MSATNPDSSVLMREIHGVGPVEATCGSCAWCVSRAFPHASRSTISYRICLKAPQPERRRSRPLAWKRAWPTCGLFQEQG